MFLLISTRLDSTQLLRWGWRVPFLASAVLVLLCLYVRLQLVETPAFRRSLEQGERVRVPSLVVLAKYPRELALGTLTATTTFVIFYFMTVFTLTWATTALGFARANYLRLQMFGVRFFGLPIPPSALLADRIGGRTTLIIATAAIVAFGFTFSDLFGTRDVARMVVFLVLGFSLTGFTYGPLGSTLASLFPTAVRYTGTSLAFNFAGILGASLAPYIANRLAIGHGVGYVGLYLSAAGIITLGALLVMRKISQ